MKKIIALLVAALLALGSCAMAEQVAAIMDLENLNVSVTGGSAGEQHVDVADLTGTLALDTAGAPTVILMIDKADDVLCAMAFQFEDGKVRVMLDNEDATYEADLADLIGKMNVPANYAEQVQQLPEMLTALVPALDTLELPPFPGVTIPMLNPTRLLTAFITGTEGNVTSFEIPYEQVMAILDLVTQYAGMFGSQIPNLDQVLSMFEQMKQGGQGIALGGTVVDNGDSTVTTVNVYPVENQVVSEEPAIALTLTSAENSDVLALGMPGGDPLATLALTSTPDEPGLRLELNANQASFTFGLYPEDGLQKCVIATESVGEGAGFSVGYGNVNDVDVVQIGISAPDGNGFSFEADTVRDEDGLRTGNLSLSGSQYGQQIDIGAGVAMEVLEESPITLTWPETVLPLEQLDPSAFQEAFTPVMDYLNSLEPAA